MLLSVSPAKFNPLHLNNHLQRHPISHTPPRLNKPTLSTGNYKTRHFISVTAKGNIVSLPVVSPHFNDNNDDELVMQQKPQETQGGKEKSFWGAVSLIIGTAVGPGKLGLPAATIRSGSLPSTMEEDGVEELSFTGLCNQSIGESLCLSDSHTHSLTISLRQSVSHSHCLDTHFRLHYLHGFTFSLHRSSLLGLLPPTPILHSPQTARTSSHIAVESTPIFTVHSPLSSSAGGSSTLQLGRRQLYSPAAERLTLRLLQESRGHAVTPESLTLALDALLAPFFFLHQVSTSSSVSGG
ncbi:hypothetical protein Patl1_22994 [Pistacia atlantica]|uniref:Uncharacterized protein n=1 Tax=Pistacia atlantica TaxID=434234 RepID=A0ACC0ZW65_9ROSI|nr:hypothetical protein Patl1_22994 [Pistacia atlantica]